MLNNIIDSPTWGQKKYNPGAAAEDQMLTLVMKSLSKMLLKSSQIITLTLSTRTEHPHLIQPIIIIRCSFHHTRHHLNSPQPFSFWIVAHLDDGPAAVWIMNMMKKKTPQRSIVYFTLRLRWSPPSSLSPGTVGIVVMRLSRDYIVNHVPTTLVFTSTCGGVLFNSSWLG